MKSPFFFASSSISFNLATYSGVVPQHPPITFAPNLSISLQIVANSSADTLYVLVTGSGNPALAFTTIGRYVHLDISSTIGSKSFGPNEQLTPNASTPSPCNVRHMADTEHPVNVRLFSSNVIVVITGRLEFSFAARTAAFVSSKSVIVSITITSAPSAATTSSLKISYASSKVRLPVGSRS